MVALSRLWDRLGTMLWVGFLGFLLSLTLFLFPPVLAATADAAVRTVRGEEYRFADFFMTGRRYFLRSWALFAVLAAVISGLVFNISFYSSREGLGWLAALSVTLALFFLAATVVPFAFPAMVRDDLGLWSSLRVATLAALRKPLNSISVTLVAVFLAVLLFLSTVGLVLYLPLVTLLAAAALEGVIPELKGGDPRP
jgi:uncharacterized membrane protein YesL